MKHKRNDDGLLMQIDYWEMKLGIKHNTEKARYKKLCGYKLAKKDRLLLDGAYYITFSDWKEYMDAKLSVLDKKELFEYSKYINSQLHKGNIFSGVLSNFMLPVAVSIITSVFTELFMQVADKSFDNYISYIIIYSISYLIKLGMYLCVLLFFIKMVVDNVQENKADNLFYKDMYEIVNSKSGKKDD